MLCRFLQKRILNCPRSWKSAKPNFRPHWPQQGSPKRPPLVIYTSKDKYFAKHGFGANLTNEIADGAGLNPERQHLLRQLKAGEKVLTKVRREKNDLQDANTKLGVELKDVRAQLSDSVKENQRLRRGIFSKCLNEPFKRKFGGAVD